MTTRNTLSLLFLSVLMSMSCSGNNIVSSYTKRRKSPPAITEVVHIIQLPSGVVLQNGLGILQNRNHPVRHLNRAKQQIRTNWLPVRDRLCGSYPASGAVLECEVRYTIDVIGLAENLSQVRISYQQRCDKLEGRNLLCPHSAGEYGMLDLARDFQHMSN